MTKHLQISIIGAGRVGSHLAKRCKQKGVKVLQICNRDLNKGKQLSRLVDSKHITHISDLDAITPDIIFIAVKDSAISDVSKQIALLNPTCLVVHVSGVYPVASLADILPRAGGFYPLMTFNTQSRAPWSKIPIGIAATKSSDIELLKSLAQVLAHSYFLLDDAQRTGLHVAAVFANNFTNYLLGRSFDLVQRAGLEKHVLTALIEQTVQLALRYAPEQLQTGPAIRKDRTTIQVHEQYLSQDKKLLELYHLFTELIQESQNE